MSTIETLYNPLFLLIYMDLSEVGIGYQSIILMHRIFTGSQVVRLPTLIAQARHVEEYKVDPTPVLIF